MPGGPAGKRILLPRVKESHLYFGLVLVVIAACVGGFMMFLYSGLLILLNRSGSKAASSSADLG